MRKVLILCLLVFMVLPGWAALAAPEEQAQPTIGSFTTTATLVDRTQLAAKTARIPVAWTATNRPNTANLVFEQVMADGKVVNVELPRDNPWVASSGNGVVAPVPPGGTATQITFRLRLIDLLTQNTLAQRDLTLPIGDAPTPKPTVTTFTATPTTVNKTALENRTARIPVSWAADNRPNNSNLVFEQVMADGTAVNVELPRSNPYVASAGNGVVAPVPPGGTATSFVVRVRLIDLATQNTLDKKEVTITIDNTPGPTPTITIFNIGASSVSSTALANRTARIPVSWAVENRPENANLVFEQVLADNRVVNVELPRTNPVIPSSGNGVVAPNPPGSGTKINLRVRLLDLRTGNVYATKEGTVDIVEGNVPAIVAFATTAQSVDRQAILSRTARIPVSWEVINRPNTANLKFEQILEDGTAVNVELPRDNPYVGSAGAGVVAPVAPQKNETTSITLRLRLFDIANTTVYAERQITLPVSAGQTGSFIRSFATTSVSIDPATLQNRTARIPVSWEVTNRPQNSNLVFEQVMPDGRIVNVELPRTTPIVPSAGLGVVAPLPPGGNAASVRIQMRLINLSTFATLDSKEFTVAITGAAVPTNTPSASADAPQISSFTSDTNPASPGATITLSWQVTNATTINIGIKDVAALAAAPPLESTALAGTTTFVIPPDAASKITFVLTAKNAAGQAATKELEVSITGLPAPTQEVLPEETPEATP